MPLAVIVSFFQQLPSETQAVVISAEGSGLAVVQVSIKLDSSPMLSQKRRCSVISVVIYPDEFYHHLQKYCFKY